MRARTSKRPLLLSLNAVLLLSLGCSSSGSSGAPLAAAPAASSPGAPGASMSSSSATAGSRLTRYPVVLVHGAGGFRRFGIIDYFHRLPGHLRGLGYEVLVTQTSPINTVDTRSRELRDQIFAAYPDPAVKVNIIAHSQGGLDARALIGQLGLASKVASLTTVSTPHQGTPIADVALGLIPGPVQSVIDFLLNTVGWDWGVVMDISVSNMQNNFNPANPLDPGVYYQSFGGVADPLGLNGDLLSPIFYLSWTLIDNLAGPNDGLVPVDSAKLGLWRGTIPADHLDEIGQIFGASSFDHIRFYTEIVEDLALRGF